jgi:hypothetical protein
MTPQLRLASSAVLTACVLFTYSSSSQTAYKSKANPNHPSGAYDADKIRAAAPAVTHRYTLQRARDYQYAGGNVDCPNCKDWYHSLIVIPGGGKITAIQWIARRPTVNNHWYRCFVEARCGVGEFSDPNDGRQDCIGKSQCFVNRATDDGVGGYEDDFDVSYQ